jgi:DNA-directed RNA polymerase subunit A"
MTVSVTPDTLASILTRCSEFISAINQPVFQQRLGFIAGDLARQYETVKHKAMTPEGRDAFADAYVKNYRNCCVQPGIVQGAVSAQSTGQPTTQNTLNTFHTAGHVSSNISTGVQHMQEILNATAKPSKVRLQIHFTTHYASVEAMWLAVAHRIRECLFSQLLLTTETRTFERATMAPPTWLAAHELLCGPIHESRTHVVQFFLSKNSLVHRSVTPSMIADRVHGVFNGMLHCAVGPMVEARADVLMLVFFDWRVCGDASLVAQYVREAIVPSMDILLISGCRHIKDLYPMRLFETGEWYCETLGANFQAVMLIDGVDPLRTSSSNIWDIHNMLGVEATRQFLIDDLNTMFNAGGKDDLAIVHIMLLVDQMTHNGSIIPVSRIGIPREVGPLAKAAFEEALHNILRGGVNNELDLLRSVPSCVVTGKPLTCGTGATITVLNTGRVMARCAELRAAGVTNNYEFVPPGRMTLPEFVDHKPFPGIETYHVDRVRSRQAMERNDIPEAAAASAHHDHLQLRGPAATDHAAGPAGTGIVTSKVMIPNIPKMPSTVPDMLAHLRRVARFQYVQQHSVGVATVPALAVPRSANTVLAEISVASVVDI